MVVALIFCTPRSSPGWHNLLPCHTEFMRARSLKKKKIRFLQKSQHTCFFCHRNHNKGAFRTNVFKMLRKLCQPGPRQDYIWGSLELSAHNQNCEMSNANHPFCTENTLDSQIEKVLTFENSEYSFSLFSAAGAADTHIELQSAFFHSYSSFPAQSSCFTNFNFYSHQN